MHPSAAATALVALGGRLVLQSSQGRREVSVEAFLTPPEQDVRRESALGADEVLERVLIPAPSAQLRTEYFKQKEKQSFDWPIADVAVALEMNGKTCRKASIVLGAAAPVPYRATGAEKLLSGRSVDAAAANAAAEAALAGATPLSGNGYKVPVFRTIIRRTILAAVGGGA